MIIFVENIIVTIICCSDPVSGIREGEIGLGRSTRDTYILEWTPVENISFVQYSFRLPDGIPVWVKVRVTNNGRSMLHLHQLFILIALLNSWNKKNFFYQICLLFNLVYWFNFIFPVFTFCWKNVFWMDGTL